MVSVLKLRIDCLLDITAFTVRARARVCVCVCVAGTSSQYRKDSVTFYHEGFSDAVKLTEFLDLLMIEKDRKEEVL